MTVSQYLDRYLVEDTLGRQAMSNFATALDYPFRPCTSALLSPTSVPWAGEYCTVV